jgi:hypothetical protein
VRRYISALSLRCHAKGLGIAESIELRRNEVDLGVKAAGNAAALGLPLHAANQCVIILNQMVQYSRSRLDASFAAPSDVSVDGMPETLEQLDEILVTLDLSGGRS